MPEPVWPISATVLPGRDLEVDLVQHRPVGGVAEASRSKRIAPGPAGSSTAPGRSSTPSGSSITSKIRSPDAVARCAWPIHMPRLRSGTISIASSRLKTKNSLSVSEPLTTIRPAASSTARLREQRQEREQRHVDRALAERAHRRVEDGSRRALEQRLAALLLRERLDDVDADDRLLGDRRDVAELLLDVAQHGVRDVAVAVGDRDDQRA